MGLRSILRAKIILQSSSSSNNTDKTENKTKKKLKKENNKNHPSLHVKRLRALHYLRS